MNKIASKFMETTQEQRDKIVPRKKKKKKKEEETCLYGEPHLF